MEREIGKWLLDVAKYIATAVVVRAFFDDIRLKWLFYTIGIVGVVAVLILGLYLKLKKERRTK